MQRVTNEESGKSSSVKHIALKKSRGLHGDVIPAVNLGSRPLLLSSCSLWLSPVLLSIGRLLLEIPSENVVCALCNPALSSTGEGAKEPEIRGCVPALKCLMLSTGTRLTSSRVFFSSRVRSEAGRSSHIPRQAKPHVNSRF